MSSGDFGTPVAAGPALIKNETMAEFLESFGQHNGYLVGGFGDYGTNYILRGVISTIGLGAFTSDQAIFAMSWTDFNKRPLMGSTNYVLPMDSFPASGRGLDAYRVQLDRSAGPPTRSIDTSSAMRRTLPRNDDGSVDFYLQSTAPTDPAKFNNWLPTPANGTGFEVMWRLLAPDSANIPGILNGTGWLPPEIAVAA